MLTEIEQTLIQEKAMLDVKLVKTIAAINAWKSILANPRAGVPLEAVVQSVVEVMQEHLDELNASDTLD